MKSPGRCYVSIAVCDRGLMNGLQGVPNYRPPLVVGAIFMVLEGGENGQHCT